MPYTYIYQVLKNMSVDFEFLVTGAGMSGLGFAIQLFRWYGITDFEIVEKSNGIGGTWWLNSYPGCGCDVGPKCSF